MGMTTENTNSDPGAVLQGLGALGLREDGMMTVDAFQGRFRVVAAGEGVVRSRALGLPVEGEGTATFAVGALKSALRLGATRFRCEGETLHFAGAGLCGWLGDAGTAHAAPAFAETHRESGQAPPASVSASALQGVLRVTWAAAPAKRAWASLQSHVRLEQQGGVLSACACDGNVLAQACAPGGEGAFKALVPRTAARELARVLRDQEGAVTVRISRLNWLLLGAGDVELGTRLGDGLGQSEPWPEVLQRPHAPLGAVTRAELLARLRALRSEMHVALQADGGELRLGGAPLGPGHGAGHVILDRRELLRAAEGLAQHGDTLTLALGERQLHLSGRDTGVVACRPV